MKLCIIEACGNELAPGSRLNACAACRANFSYWRHKRPAQVLERRRKLLKYSDRMASLFDRKGASHGY